MTKNLDNWEEEFDKLDLSVIETSPAVDEDDYPEDFNVDLDDERKEIIKSFIKSLLSAQKAHFREKIEGKKINVEGLHSDCPEHWINKILSDLLTDL